MRVQPFFLQICPNRFEFFTLHKVQVLNLQEKADIPSLRENTDLLRDWAVFFLQHIFIRADAETDRNPLRQGFCLEIFLFDTDNQREEVDVVHPEPADGIGVFPVKICIILYIKGFDYLDLPCRLRVPFIVAIGHAKHHFFSFQLADLLFQIFDGRTVSFQDRTGISAAAGCLNGIQRKMRSAKLPDIQEIQEIRIAVFIISIFRVLLWQQKPAIPIFPNCFRIESGQLCQFIDLQDRHHPKKQKVC